MKDRSKNQVKSLLRVRRARPASSAILRWTTGLSLLAAVFVGERLFAQDLTSVQSKSNQLSTRTYYDGAETLGRVGHEAILRRDILHQIKKAAHMRYLEEIEKIPEDQREEARQPLKEGILNQYLNSDQYFSLVLDNHIRKLLFYNDYIVSRPKDQVKEQTDQLEKEFDKRVLPEMEDQFHCKNLRELEKYFEDEIQSDFAQEKRIFIQQTLGELWENYNLGQEDFNPTLTDLKRFYESNTDKYRIENKVRWQAMTVYFGSNRTKEEARKKIAHMGNAVQSVQPSEQEKMFAEVCKVDSEDSFKDKGGYREWTTKGVLNSKEIENAIFSETLPVGALSKIIETNNSLTIVRVVEREEARIKNFTEVQEQVKDDLVEARTEAMKKKYEERLSERFKVEIYALTPEEREKCFRTASRTETSATGRAPIY